MTNGDKCVIHTDIGFIAKYHVIVDYISERGIHGRYKVLPNGNMRTCNGCFPLETIVYLRKVKEF